MAKENTEKRAFHEDMFADDNDKYSWPTNKPGTSTTNMNTSNYDAYAHSDSSSNGEGEFVMRGDSNSQPKSAQRRNSSTDENNSLSSDRRVSHERLPPSIYDDDARSGSPGNVAYDNKNLAFDSFSHSLKASQKESGDNSLAEAPSSVDVKETKTSPSPPCERPKSDSRDDRLRRSPLDHRSRERRSKSREAAYRRRSRSRSRSRERRHGRDRFPERRGPGRGRRSRSREYRYGRRSRSRSHERRRRRECSPRRERQPIRPHSRSRSHSRDQSRGSSGHKSSASTKAPSVAAVTPQMALAQTMAAMTAKAQALTGIALPKYYNPAAVNPLKYAEQVQKRKLLWQKKDEKKEEEEQQAAKPKGNVWDKLTFAQDQDGRMTAKFRKLMGIKSEGGGGPTTGVEPGASSADGPLSSDESVFKKQEELFRDLDQQYEVARVTTHTQRGVGLGYSHQPLYPMVLPK